ncbi:MAG: hypothetical protein LW878_01155 [Proteobacteria bacterium]|jgi:hypothetical protein|nr:hypothetical protein [Pseudomonadota bacterium]
MIEASSESTLWESYYNTTFRPTPLVESETPFYGTNWWAQLSEIEKKKLELGFRQINAEVIIHLEQGLLVSARRLRSLGHPHYRELKEFVSDELVHIKAFRDYLDLEFEGDWRNQSLLLFKKDRYRKFAHWLFRWEPLSVFLPGAKSEIYAIQYFLELRKKEEQLNSRWFKLIQLHAQDEVSHIQTDFDFLNLELARMSFIQKTKLYIATILSVALTQWSLMLTAFRLIDRVFFHKNKVEKVYLTAVFTGWVLWKHSAFPNTRKVFSRHIQKEEKRYFKHFSFLGW